MDIRITSFLTAAIILGANAVGFAQGYDDDDIYFNPSKAKSESKKKNNIAGTQIYQATVPDNRAGVNIDIDTYNRRGVFAAADTASEASESGDFNYTRQIERFYNPDVVTSSSDAELASLYYSQPATDVNIYINAVPSYGYWGYPYSSWYWGYTRPYSWYWNCGWDPYWAWGPSWTWGPGWGWGPSWSWGHGWGHGWGHAIPSRPNRPSGNIRPGHQVRPSGSIRPSYRLSSRPSAGTNGTYRPGSSSSGYRQSGGSVRNGSGSIRKNNSGVRQNNNSHRQNSNSNTNSYRNSNNSYRNSNNSSFRNNSNGSTYRSSGSFGGYRGGGAGSMGGGSRGGGGGRGRH